MLQSPVLSNGRRVLTRAVAAQWYRGAGPRVAIEVERTRGRWFRFGFAPLFGSWFRSPRRFPRRDEYLHMLEEYRNGLEEELAEVRGEIEWFKKGQVEEKR